MKMMMGMWRRRKMMRLRRMMLRRKTLRRKTDP